MDNELASVIAASGVAATLLITMVIGSTELVRRLFKRDYEAAALIFVSAMVGGLGGMFLFEAIGFALGVAMGLSASGFVTFGQKFGQGTVAKPTDISRN